MKICFKEVMGTCKAYYGMFRGRMDGKERKGSRQIRDKPEWKNEEGRECWSEHFYAQAPGLITTSILVKLYSWIFVCVHSSAHLCARVCICEIAKELPVEQLESNDESSGDQQLEELGSGFHPWIDQVFRNSYQSSPYA